MNTTATTGISTQFRRHFEKKLLEKAKDTLVLNQFAKSADLPKMLGSKTIRFFRAQSGTSADVQTLVEGTPITTFKDMSYEHVDVDLIQIGEAMKFSDILGWTQLLNVLTDGIEVMGEDAALKGDDITLATICGSSSVVKRYSGGAADFAALGALSASAGKFTSIDGLDACTQLKINKAPKINGEYVGIVSPQVSRDLRLDDRWVEANNYAATKQLMKGEIGSLDGVRYIETTNTWTEDDTEGTREEGAIISSIFTGREAYGTVKLSGTSPYKPTIIIVDKADKSDPLNQFMTAGWKAFYNSVLLNGKWASVVRSKTAFA